MTAPSPTATLWHNPKCATSRKVLEALRAHGVEPVVVAYLQTPPDAATLRAVLAEMGAGPAAILRRKNNEALLAGEPTDGFSDAALIDLMVRHPVLIERPILRTPKGTVLCRPPERWRDVVD